MQKLHYSIQINAPKEKVWDLMLADKTYREWTDAFHKGSYYKGSWEKGSKIYFLGPSEKGEDGMVCLIAENKPYEFISIKSLGFIENGVEDTTSETVKAWGDAYENYTFNEIEEGKTELLIDLDTEEKYADMFNVSWPQALRKLKEIAER